MSKGAFQQGVHGSQHRILDVTEAEQITRRLQGKWYGSYGIACCPAHEDSNPSLSLAIGQAGRLLAHCKAGCTFPSIIDALRTRGVIGQTVAPTTIDRDGIEQFERTCGESIKRKTLWAERCWQDAVPIEGTIAESYLRSRKIDCVLPKSLRFAAECWHPSGQSFPAMVASIDGARDFAIHRTYLRKDGGGKAEIEPVKAMLGSAKGGAVALLANPGH